MLKETALRKKLQEIDIPSWGSKDLLKRRHIEWLNIYNSNCDADDSLRKSKKQLLRELDEWEQTQGGKAGSKESKIMRKDFDGDGHARLHKSDFDDLIAQARKARTSKKAGEVGENGTGKAEVEPTDSTSREAQQAHETLLGISNSSMVEVPNLPVAKENIAAQPPDNLQNPQIPQDTQRSQGPQELQDPQHLHYDAKPPKSSHHDVGPASSNEVDSSLKEVLTIHSSPAQAGGILNPF